MTLDIFDSQLNDPNLTPRVHALEVEIAIARDGEEDLNTRITNIVAGETATALKTQVYTIGDSMSNNTYQSRLRTRLGADWNVVAKGIGGNTVAQMLARFAGDVVTVDAEYVVIFGGINSVLGNVSAVNIQADLQAMYSAAKANGSTVVAVTIAPFGGHVSWTAPRQTVVDTVNAWILATATDVDFAIDAYTALEDPATPDTLLPAYNSGDSLHLSVAGYNHLGDTIYNNATWTADETERTLFLSAADVQLSQSLRPSDTARFAGLNIFGAATRVDTATPLLGWGTRFPQRPIHLEGAQIATGVAQQYAGNLIINTTGAAAEDSGGMIGLGGVYSGVTPWTFAAIRGAKENATSDTAGYMALYTTAVGGAVIERMRVSSGGHVGINRTQFDATQPATFLDINAQEAHASGNKTAAFNIRNFLLTLTGAASTTYAEIYSAVIGRAQLFSNSLNQVVTRAASLRINHPLESTNVTVDTAYALYIPSSSSGATKSWGVFVEAATGAGDDYAAAFTGGNVGIGIAEPQARLHTDGTIIFANLPTSNPSVAGQLWNDGGTLKVSAG
jgi:lysophospholipase L1-like esterase